MVYYNGNDKKSYIWLWKLIEAGLIPYGFVDNRSIADIKGEQLSEFTQCHFFAGIGGWPLALHLAGVPETERVWTGSCPCQPFSSAGKRKGAADERHLWPEFKRLIEECRLEDQAAIAGWMTPTGGGIQATPSVIQKKTAYRESVGRGYWPGSLEEQVTAFITGTSTSSSPAETEKRGALNPELPRWLMGYPEEWGSCGATAMQSFRK